MWARRLPFFAGNAHSDARYEPLTADCRGRVGRWPAWRDAKEDPDETYRMGAFYADNPRLVLLAPLPPTTRSRKDFQPPDRLRDSTTHCVHSKPNGQNQTADSQISTSSGRWPQDDAYGE